MTDAGQTYASPSSMMDIRIVAATPQQEVMANLREGAEWHGPLMTPRQYLEREAHLVDSALSRDGRRQKWVMVPPTAEPGTLDFLASCETHRRPMLVLKPGHSEPCRAVVYSICSVVVPPDKRKRGYASLMMTLLHQHLSSTGRVPFPTFGEQVSGQDGPTTAWEQDPALLDARHDGDSSSAGDATASFLYSDIGDFYEAFEWKRAESRHVEWQVQDGAAGGTSSSSSPAAVAPRWLTADELVDIAQLDRKLLLRTFARAAETIGSQGQKIRFAIDDPEARAWRWRIERDNFTARFADPPLANRPTRYGVILGGGDGGGTADGPAYAAWTYDAAHRQLKLLRLQFETAAQFRTLVDLLKGEAQQHGMRSIEAWNVDLAKLGIAIDQPTQARLWKGEKVAFERELAGGELVERDDVHLPSVAWYGERRGGQHVEWLLNEYGWYI
ncbi:uncharacterized protein PFL1_04459 [Pseudozyma flocculosa PF-1]|uniref:LYC1 C-terminal domain-containing protein n=2 Tax=Pseudozyma flocculosa TaxID=84751 RepID=A0A5C3FBW9_9BASI|nr:uncharacterized protein PFL1_04459 [Pseudozyma flocculosa PF-1]EPQ28132.1 hypothetical protein PFL1_04459 [Pseudozyma flocculosa PF-1]SPO41933.1 uncharacterized protein PSFLO_07416 [Pseudozyma flocculosa]